MALEMSLAPGAAVVCILRATTVPWTTIRNLSRLKFLGFSYGVLAGVPFLAHVTQLIPIVELPWTIFWVFVSALFVAIATTLYSTNCPEDIKNYKTREHFVRTLLPLEENASPTKKADIIGTHSTDAALKRELAELLALQASGKASGVQKRRLAEIISSNYSSAVQRYLSDKWDRQNSSTRGMRTVASISLGIAGAIALGLWGYRVYVLAMTKFGGDISG